MFQKQQELPVVAMYVNRSGRNGQASQRTFHRCFLPSFGSFGKVVLEKKIFKNRPIRKNNCLWQPCLVMDHSKMCTHQRGPSIDDSSQVSVQLAEGFQSRGLKCEKLRQMTDDRRQTPSDDKSSLYLWQGELKRILKCEYLHVMYINMLHYIYVLSCIILVSCLFSLFMCILLYYSRCYCIYEES